MAVVLPPDTVVPMGRTTKAGFAVALVDPLPCMRAGLTLYLERSGNYRVVLSVATGEELIAAVAVRR